MNSPQKKGSPRVAEGTRLSSQRIPAAIRRESRSIALLLEFVARGQYVAWISFSVPPLHLLGTAVDDLPFTREVDHVQAHGNVVIEIVGDVEVDLIVGVDERRK